jgi:hypothetical protein
MLLLLLQCLNDHTHNNFAMLTHHQLYTITLLHLLEHISGRMNTLQGDPQTPGISGSSKPGGMALYCSML